MPRSHQGPTALHFTVIVLTIATVMLIAATFLFYREGQEMLSAVRRVELEREKLVRQVRDQDDRIMILKEVLGYSQADVGQSDDQDPATVTGAVRTDIRRMLGQSSPNQSVSAREAMIRLSSERDNLAIERDALVDSKSTLLANYRALERVWKAVLRPEREARLTAERELRTNLQSREEVLSEKDREIDNLRAESSGQRDQITELQQALEKQDTVMLQKFALHRSTVRRLNRMLQRREAHRFEQSDGRITLVDDSGRMVWVDLGASDKLVAGIRFSVFDKSAEQVGGSRKGLKGVIEISRVTGAHRSQARVIQRERTNPLLTGDLVFSPIWSVGHSENFALVGLVDLNDDGRSDIEGLRRYVAESGAVISTWVDDSGARNGGSVDMSVKYLIVANTPTPDAARNDQQRTAYNRLLGHLTSMREEAYDHGVRVIRLNDFLAYIGYTKGLGTGLSVTREGEAGSGVRTGPGAKPPRVSPGKTSPLKRSPRTPPAKVSGRFGNSRGVKSPARPTPEGTKPR